MKKSKSKKSKIKPLYKRHLGLLAVMVLAFAAVTGLYMHSVQAKSIPVPATAVFYGDSIMYESTSQMNAQFASKSGWTDKITAFPGSAPCDWFTQLQTDLSTLHPNIVVLETQGNSITDCMKDSNGNLIPFGSQAWLDKYRTDIDFYFSNATATGAKVLYVNALPEPNTTTNKQLNSLIAVAKTEAGKYHGVSVTGAPRNSVSSSGAFVWRKNCLAGETAAMGCGSLVAGKITVRSPDGVHLCPINFTDLNSWYAGCQVYSSGEVRWGQSIVNTTVAPPAPLLK